MRRITILAVLAGTGVACAHAPKSGAPAPSTSLACAAELAPTLGFHVYASDARSLDASSVAGDSVVSVGDAVDFLHVEVTSALVARTSTRIAQLTPLEMPFTPPQGSINDLTLAQMTSAMSPSSATPPAERVRAVIAATRFPSSARGPSERLTWALADRSARATAARSAIVKQCGA